MSSLSRSLRCLALLAVVLQLLCLPHAAAAQTQGTFLVRGYLAGATFNVSYQFLANSTLISGVQGTPSAQWLINSVSGNRTYANFTTAGTTVAGLFLNPPNSFGLNDNQLWPNTVGPTNSTAVTPNLHAVVTYNGLTFNLSQPQQFEGYNAVSQVCLFFNVSGTNLYFEVFPGPLQPDVEAIGITTSNFTALLVTTAAVSGVLGDPQFVGLRGQSFQVHSIDGAVYALVSSPSTQVNARFAFLTAGVCPPLIRTNCWSHPGSYVGALSFQQRVEDGQLYSAVIEAGPASTGFRSILVDGQAMTIGQRITHGTSFDVQLRSSHEVVVSTAEFEFVVSNSDGFVNQALRPLVPLSQLQAHGLLGQTHSLRTHTGAIRYIEGEVDDYALPDADLMASDFVYNRFQATA